MPLFRVSGPSETQPLVTARRFDGATDYVEAPDSTTLRSPSTAVTVAGWVRWYGPSTSGEQWNALLMKQWGGVSPWLSYAIQQNAATNLAYRFRIGDGVASHNTANTTGLAYGTWYYLAGTWASGQAVTLRVWNTSGTLVQTVTSTAPVTTTIAYTDAALFFAKNEASQVAAADLAGWLVHNAVLDDFTLGQFRNGLTPMAPSAGYWPLRGDLDPDTGAAAVEVDTARGNNGIVQVTNSIRTGGPKVTGDPSEPTPAGVVVGDVGTSRFTVTWKTPKYASSAVQYGTTAALGSTAVGVATPDNLAHSVTVTGLTPGTLYYARARSIDAGGVIGYSVNELVSTSSADSTAPLMSGLRSVVAGTSVTITWTTDEPATSRVDFGPTVAYSSGSASQATYVTSHSITLTGLIAGLLYHYRIRSADLAGNEAIGTDATFTTDSASSGYVALSATGTRLSSHTPSSAITTTAHGQVISGRSFTASSALTIAHDNVVVEDCYFDWHPTTSGQYAIKSAVNPDTGLRPANTTLRYLTIDGRVDATMIDAVVAVYVELWRGVYAHHLRITDVGRGFRFRDDCILEDSYIVADYHQAGSAAHRTAAACDGGQRNIIRRNQLICRGSQSSSALSIYNDAKETFNFLIENNYLGATDGYISYGGCLTSKAFPVASDVKYYNNTFNFETPYGGPLYGGITAHNNGVRGNERVGNTWLTGWTRNDGVVFAAGSEV